MARIAQNDFGTLKDGRRTRSFTIRNEAGMELTLSDFGARMVSLTAPDREGRLDDVLMGFDDAQSFAENGRYNGATCGRYANRIHRAVFLLGGKTYRLFANDGLNALHGGPTGFHSGIWAARTVGERLVRFSLTSPDGHEGYPGNLEVEVTYTLTENNEVIMDYRAECDQDTPLNLTNHAFWNLGGHSSGEMVGHMLQLNADFFTPIDAEAIPFGSIAPVAGTAFDFTRERRIGDRLFEGTEQLQNGGGYDHNFVLRKAERGALSVAAKVWDPQTGRMMTIATTEPGIQFYSGNKIREMAGKGGASYRRHCAFCLETQRFPDSVRHTHFSNPILRAGTVYVSRTVHAFSTN